MTDGDGRGERVSIGAEEAGEGRKARTENQRNARTLGGATKAGRRSSGCPPAGAARPSWRTHACPACARRQSDDGGVEEGGEGAQVVALREWGNRGLRKGKGGASVALRAWVGASPAGPRRGAAAARRRRPSQRRGRSRPGHRQRQLRCKLAAGWACSRRGTARAASLLRVSREVGKAGALQRQQGAPWAEDTGAVSPPGGSHPHAGAVDQALLELFLETDN